LAIGTRPDRLLCKTAQRGALQRRRVFGQPPEEPLPDDLACRVEVEIGKVVVEPKRLYKQRVLLEHCGTRDRLTDDRRRRNARDDRGTPIQPAGAVPADHPSVERRQHAICHQRGREFAWNPT
jgi:hypothetical protein